jgi:DNA-binding Lrp family transcriptional regulator
MSAAFVLVNCHFPYDPRITDAISRIMSVTNIYRTEGRYDLILRVNAESNEKLRELISRDIDAIHGVDATITMIIA